MSQEDSDASPGAPAPPKKPAFRFVRDEGERAEGINALFNRFTGRQRSMQAYRWEWFEGHPGPGFMWAIVDEAGNVVGHHGIIQTPLVVAGIEVPAGRTENTIIEPEVRKKIFYPGMEKKAFTEVLKSLAVLYTVHASGAQGRIRERLGYHAVGRWLVYLPIVRAGYLEPLAIRLAQRLAPSLAGVAPLAARLAGGLLRAAERFRRGAAGVSISEISNLEAFESEYRRFWDVARGRYDVTIDRTWEFLRWRAFVNPNIECKLWAIRRANELIAVVIGHRHSLGRAFALYVDDILTRDYECATFVVALRCLPQLMPDADGIVVMTLDADTPLKRALEKVYPLQAQVLRRLAPKLFDEVVVYDRDGVCEGEKWFVTPLFTEGLDTSRV